MSYKSAWVPVWVHDRFQLPADMYHEKEGEGSSPYASLSPTCSLMKFELLRFDLSQPGLMWTRGKSIHR